MTNEEAEQKRKAQVALMLTVGLSFLSGVLVTSALGAAMILIAKVVR